MPIEDPETTLPSRTCFFGWSVHVPTTGEERPRLNSRRMTPALSTSGSTGGLWSSDLHLTAGYLPGSTTGSTCNSGRR